MRKEALRVLAALPRPRKCYFVQNFGTKINGAPDLRLAEHHPSIFMDGESLMGVYDRDTRRVILPPRRECVRIYRQMLGSIYWDLQLDWLLKDLLFFALYRRQIDMRLSAVDEPFLLLMRLSLPHLSPQEVCMIAERMPMRTKIRRKLLQMADAARSNNEVAYRQAA